MLDMYEAWLAKNHFEHTAGHLHTWACEVYTPEALLAHRVG